MVKNPAQAKWAKKNPGKRKVYECNWRWKNSGIMINKQFFTYNDYNQMFIDQEGCCKICGDHQADLSKALCVDHCHITNEARGLLCNKCNTLLGMSKDNIEILKSAIKYLEKHQ